MKVSLTGLSTQRSPAAQIPSPRVPNAKPSANMISASTPPCDTKYKSIKCLKPVNLSDITSKIDGTSLGEMLQVWKDAAASEIRINMLDNLLRKKVGLREVEQFSLGLRYGFKSQKMQSKGKPVEGVVEAAMAVKLKDEKEHRREAEKRKEDLKAWLAKKYHPKNKNYKKIIQYLRQEADKEKQEMTKKSKMKIKHLEDVYRRKEESHNLFWTGGQI